MAEHNFIAVSKLYKNIKIEELGRFLRLEPLKAELLAGKMISEGHIEGSIDQVSRFINFTSKGLTLKFIVFLFKKNIYIFLLLNAIKLAFT